MAHAGLNWGCGPEPADGWENVDRLTYGHDPVPFTISDILTDPLPWPDDSFSMVDLQSKHCTTGQFKGQVDSKLNPPSLFQVQNLRGGD